MRREIAQSVVVATTLLRVVVCIGVLGCIAWLPDRAAEVGVQATAGGAVAPANGI